MIIAGCSPTWKIPATSFSQPSTMIVCVDVQQDSLQSISDAIDDWNTALTSWKKLELQVGSVGDPSCSISIEDVDRLPVDDPDAIALTNGLGGNRIYLLKGSYEMNARTVVSHELGHVFGAQHVNGTLMSSRSGGARKSCPDVTTMAQVAAYNDLNLETLSWCY